ncbi:MAG: TonB-dependent receptor [Bacteroidales bacterium]|nr:TonB-dependent receptor [Bacteroidales bacterium]
MMKLSAVFLFLSIMCLSAKEGHSQNANVNLNVSDKSIAEVLKDMENQTSYLFFYNEKDIDVNKIVTGSFINSSVSDVLASIFSGTDTHYSLYKDYIVLSKNNIVNKTIGEQKNAITGKVTNESGEPLPGVSVIVKGTTTGTITDINGSYSLANISENATLQFSFVGMKTLEVKVGNQTSIDAVLADEMLGLDEVVVIGYGTVKKMDLTGSVSTVQGDNLASKNSVMVSQALQGTMPGVMVTRTGSAANASSTIKIRGVTTIGESSPLVIVDGIPGSLDWINPNDIESISVLKDAASASIYGSRAAAGVILVTTKRAKTGQLSVTYNYETSIEQPTRVAQYADAQKYMSLYNELTWNDNNNIAGKEYSLYSKELIENYPTLHAENPDKYPDTDWTGMMLNEYAPRESHALNLTAGSKNISTSFSLVYDKTKALYNGRNFDRLTMRSNNDVVINKYLSMEVDFNSLYSINKQPVIANDTYYGVLPGPIAAPVYAAVWEDGRIGAGKSGRNDYALLNYGGHDNSKTNTLGGKIQLNFTPIEGLKFSAVFSPQLYNAKSKTFRNKLTYTEWDSPNTIAGTIENATTTSLNEYRNDNYSTTTQFLSNYVKDFKKHNINLMMGFEEYHYFYESLGASRDQYSLTEFPYLDLGNGNYQYNSGNAYENAYRSFFGRIMYNFDNKYFFQANSRYDGSSRFDKDYRWGLFPSFSAGWVVSRESFMKDIEPISFLKIRASWGTLGNERIGNYPYQSKINFGSTLLYQGYDVVAAQTAGITDYAIKDISWETTETVDFGIDANFFKNKLTFSGDLYRKTTKDMLLALAIPNYIGLNDPDQNTGKMNTTGWEFAIGWADQKGNFKYSVSANLSDSKSVMGDLGGTQFLGSQVKYEGSEFNEWYGYKSEGLYQTDDEVANSAVLNSRIRPGDIKYTDINGVDGVPDGKISADYDRVLLGGSLPRYLYGGNINLGYKNFDFSLVFQGVGKQNSRITANMVQPLQNFWEDVPQIYVDSYWSKYNTDEQNLKVKYPRASDVGNANNYSFSDFWLFDGSYFRLKNINMGYTIPQNIAEYCKLQNARVYVNISDWFSLDHYPKGWDPEASSYWITKTFTVGVSLKF